MFEELYERMFTLVITTATAHTQITTSYPRRRRTPSRRVAPLLPVFPNTWTDSCTQYLLKNTNTGQLIWMGSQMRNAGTEGGRSAPSDQYFLRTGARSRWTFPLLFRRRILRSECAISRTLERPSAQNLLLLEI